MTAASASAGETVRGPHRFDRHDLPGGVDLPLAHRDRQRGVSARDRRHGEGRAASSEARHFIDLVGLERLRAALSGRAVRRHAPARVDGAHARLRAENPADGRAVRGARRADPAAARRQGPADPAGAEADHAADHPQPDRGGAALRPHPGDDLPARQDQAHRRDQAAAPAHLRDRQQRRFRPLCRANLERSARGGEQGPQGRRSRAWRAPEATRRERARADQAAGRPVRVRDRLPARAGRADRGADPDRLDQSLHRAEALRDRDELRAHHRRREHPAALPADLRRGAGGEPDAQRRRHLARRAAAPDAASSGSRPRPGSRRWRRRRWC